MTALAVWSDQLDRWDLKSAQAAIFRSQHPDFVPFGNYVVECVELVRPFDDPEREWPVYGVSNRDGVFLSHMQPGADFKVPYKAILQDWFFHNPTRANVGSMGRVPEVLPYAITSPEYQVWRVVDPDWLADYVEIMLEMPFFNVMVHAHRVGAVKQRLYTRNLMEIPVPSRSRAFQVTLAERWLNGKSRIAAMAATVEQHEQALVAEVLATADISINMPPPRPKAYALYLDELDRWGVTFNQQRWTLEDIIGSTTFPRRRLSDVALVNPPRTEPIPEDGQVTFVPMEAVSEISGEIEAAEVVDFGEVSKGYTTFQEGDLIWAKITPCMQNGKSAVARHLINRVGFGSTEFHVIRPIDPDEVNPDYLWCILRLRPIRDAAQRYFTGSAGQQRVPQDFLEGLVMPIPPRHVQDAIVAAVRARRQAVAEERRRIKELRRALVHVTEAAMISGTL